MGPAGFTRSNARERALLCVWVLCAAGLFAERLAVKSYGASDGLPSERVQRIVQDSRGFLWFATADGLSRFDGYEFANFGAAQGLPDVSVSGFLEARDGAYWLATGHGVYRLQLTPTGPIFEVVKAGPMSSPFLPSVLLQDRDGTLWCGVGSHGLFAVRHEAANKWALEPVDLQVPPPFGVITLIEDRRERGVLWIGTNVGLFRRSPNGSVEKRSGIPNYVEALLEDRGGRIWAGTRSGLFSFLAGSGAADSLRRYRESDGLASSDVKALLETADGHIWSGGLIHGITEFTPAADGGYLLRSYGRAQGLSDETIISLAEDRDGNLWAGGESGGAMKIVHRGFTTFTRADGLGADRVGAIFEDRTGDLYVSTGGPGNQLNRWNGRGFESLRFQSGQDTRGEAQAALQDQTGEWWSSRGDKLRRLGERKFERLAAAPPAAQYATAAQAGEAYVFRMFADSRGGIWVSTRCARNRISYWDRSAQELRYFSSASGAPEQLAVSFAEDRAGNIWIGLDEGGVLRYRRGHFTAIGPADGIPAGYVAALYVDHAGRLWIASANGGLGRIDSPEAEQPRVVSYTIAQGLSSNSVFSIAEDRWGRVYAGTRRGVDRLDPESGRVKRFSVADGLPRGSVSVAYQDRRGDLWFGTAQGLARMTPELEAPAPPPPVSISRLQAGNRQRFAAAPERAIELDPNDDFLQVNFSGLTFAAGEQLRYQYRLEGSNGDWSTPSEQRSVVFSSLPAGKYRLLVRAVDGSGQVSAAPAAVAFSVLPRLSERWWFRTFVLLVIAAAAWAAFRYRVAQLLAVERIRTRIATDLHDHVGASLSQIAVLSDVLRRRTSSSAAGHLEPRHFEPLERIASISREMVDSMSDIVWAISPQRDRL
ncbi:MAG TPA: two-component regulator propeller domain-containing protein, partial [Bryobacteraceae bacterium]|nr:two-component regulator propeller domain-containing protein [Bryobacteraceae bacterium]